MICPFCGAEQSDDKQFCMACGKRIAGHADAEPASEPERAEGADAGVETEAARDTTGEPQADEPAEQPGAQPEPAADTAAPAAKTSVYHSVLDKKPDGDSRWATIGTGGWFGILLLMSIPVVNFICVLVWSFGGTRKQVKQSFARATLIWGLLTTILAVVGSILLPRYAGSILDWLMQLINLL